MHNTRCKKCNRTIFVTDEVRKHDYHCCYCREEEKPRPVKRKKDKEKHFYGSKVPSLGGKD